MDLKMEVYSPSLELLGVLEEYKSVIWEEKAFSAGSFSVEALLTGRTKALLQANNILWIAGDVAGMIEYFQENAENGGACITVKGYLLTGILDFRILWGLYNVSGTPSAIMRYLVQDCAVSPARGDTERRTIPGLALLDAPEGGQSVRKQKTGGSLLEALEELGETYQTAFGVRFNPAVPQMEFWTRPGADRSVRQKDNPQVFYSTELDDVLSSEYSYSSAGWRNVALVAGEGDGSGRTMVTVEAGADGAQPDEPAEYTVALSVDPEGGGLASGGGTASSGRIITVKAEPSNGYLFSGWRENGAIVSVGQSYTFTVTGDRSLTAVFEVSIPVYTIAVTVSPEGGGTVTGAGRYQAGETVTLAAAPAEGYKFTGWQENGQEVSADATYSFTASANRTFVVAFAEKPASRLPEGYTEAAYIHWSGPCCFRSGYIVTPSKIRILIDLEVDSEFSGKSEYLFYEVGTMGASTMNYYFTLSRNSETSFRIYPGTQSSSYVSLNTGSITGTRTLIDVNGPSKTVSIGEFISNISPSTIAFKTAALYIGSGSSSLNVPSSKLYSYKIYDSGALKFDFVPCVDPSGTAGLFDLAGENFYSNTLSGSVAAGPAV